jgi:hypothetical protein
MLVQIYLINGVGEREEFGWGKGRRGTEQREGQRRPPQKAAGTGKLEGEIQCPSYSSELLHRSQSRGNRTKLKVGHYIKRKALE